MGIFRADSAWRWRTDESPVPNIGRSWGMALYGNNYGNFIVESHQSLDKQTSSQFPLRHGLCTRRLSSALRHRSTVRVRRIHRIK